ncbi:ASCH domain-containing protein [Mycobacterium sp.]|uniref:ASCH domain-containing protein n=1 Tax=Mycobacterium sp. TaxID=1785 RepID=UPI00260EE8C8|nr:ASCH domain-containing protein [Mycobacterium sp.]
MTDVRALTIRQPWAALIAHGTKRVENRTWGTAWRGTLLIHAGKSADPHPDGVARVDGTGVRSAIVAVATLADIHVCDGECSSWAEPGRHHWVLSDVRPVVEPVPCKGALGLWHPHLTQDARRDLRIDYPEGDPKR